MSQLLLERLSKKNTKKQKMKPMEIKLEKGQVPVEVAIVKVDSDYDIASLKRKLRNRGLSAPALPQKVKVTIDEQPGEKVDSIIDPPVEEKKEQEVSRPKKLKTKTKLPGKINKSKIRKKRTKKNRAKTSRISA